MQSPLTNRRWQTELHRGMLKRNSAALKPAIWFFQRRRIQQFKEDQILKERMKENALWVLE